MATSPAIWGAGYDSIQVGGRDSTGVFNGFARLAATDTNVDSGMYRLLGANAASLTRGERTLVPINGDNTNLANFAFGNPQLPKIGVTQAGKDFTFDNFATGLTSDDYGDILINPGIPDDITPDAMVVLLSRNALDQGTGAQVWNHALIFNATAEETENAYGFQAAASFGYSLTQNKASRTPYGMLCSDVFATKKLAWVSITSPYRLTMHCYVGDGTNGAALVVDQTPISTALSRVFVDIAGTWTEVTPTGVTPSTKTITVASGDKPATGRLRIDLYAFDQWV